MSEYRKTLQGALDGVEFVYHCGEYHSYGRVRLVGDNWYYLWPRTGWWYPTRTHLDIHRLEPLPERIFMASRIAEAGDE